MRKTTEITPLSRYEPIMAVGTVRPASWRIELAHGHYVSVVLMISAYLNLFTHVRGGIRANASIDGTDLTNHERESDARPAAGVGELREDNRGGIARCQNPEHDNDLQTRLAASKVCRSGR